MSGGPVPPRGDDAPAFVVEYFDTEALILRTDDARLIRANQTTAAVLRRVEAGLTDEAIVGELAALFDIDRAQGAETLEAVRAQLLHFGLSLTALRDAAFPGPGQGENA